MLTESNGESTYEQRMAYNKQEQRDAHARHKAELEQKAKDEAEGKRIEAHRILIQEREQREYTEAEAKASYERKRDEKKRTNKLRQLLGCLNRVDRSVCRDEMIAQEESIFGRFDIQMTKTQQKAMLKKARTIAHYDENRKNGVKDPQPIKATIGDFPEDVIEECHSHILPAAYIDGVLDMNAHWISANAMAGKKPKFCSMEEKRFLFSVHRKSVPTGYRCVNKCKVPYCVNPWCCELIYSASETTSAQASIGNIGRVPVVFLVDVPVDTYELVPSKSDIKEAKDNGVEFDVVCHQFRSTKVPQGDFMMLKALGLVMSTSSDAYKIAIYDFKKKKSRAIERMRISGKIDLLADIKFEDDFEVFIKKEYKFNEYTEARGGGYTQEDADRDISYYIERIEDFNWRGSVVPCPHFHEALDAIRKAEKAIVKLNVGVV